MHARHTRHTDEGTHATHAHEAGCGISSICASQDRKHLEELTSDAGEAGDQILDLPASWVDRLELTRTQYENRYPGLQKTIQYKDAVLVCSGGQGWKKRGPARN